MPPREGRHLIVTLDGPAGSGKSTLARRLARRAQLLYLESGAFYRAVALMAARQGADLLNPQLLAQFLASFRPQITPGPTGLGFAVNGQDITGALRAPEVSQGASLVATLRPVRQWTLGKLHKLAETGGVIAEGRDMGTRVFPEAQVKIYLEATLEVRAHRRWLELLAQGQDVTQTQVQADMAQRDRRDQERREDPLRIPDGAHRLDSTAHSVEQMEDICYTLIQPYLT